MRHENGRDPEPAQHASKLDLHGVPKLGIKRAERFIQQKDFGTGNK